MTVAKFEVEVTSENVTHFAQLSGDWNPLHTDSRYAAETKFGRTILHGAFSAGLISRMAGMHVPGRDCLLHGMRLKFIAPIFPPVRLCVQGRQVREVDGEGAVEVSVVDVVTGMRYVEGSYEFSRHGHFEKPLPPRSDESRISGAPILVTGCSGGLGGALVSRLGDRSLGVSRTGANGGLAVGDFAELPEILNGQPISGIVHCGWPALDNQNLVDLGVATDSAIRYHIAAPVSDCIKLAQVLRSCGLPGSSLVLVGSTAAQPGRHNWRSPLYSIAKGMINSLTQIFALELGSHGMRCAAVVFDVIDGGMNADMRHAARVANADRSPAGKLASPDEAASQIEWVLANTSTFASGAVVNLSGGAIP